jgi:type IX secretion system PorP/SprF family membrane protein
MGKKLLTLVTTAVLMLPLVSFAQDAHFTQSYANPLYLNPAFAGVSKCPKVNLNYRNQYPGLSVYQTYSASYDQYVSNLNGGIGLLALRDEAGNGALSATEISAIYSYHLKASRKFTILSGFQATFRQRAINWDGLTFPDEIDPFYGFVKESSEIPPGQTTNSHFDVSVGFLGYTKNFYLGVALHHLTQPDESFFLTSKLPMKITAHTGFTIPLGRKRLNNSVQNFLLPNIVTQFQGEFNQTTLSLSFNRSSISGGLGYRVSNFSAPDAVVILLGYTPEEGAWSVGYSYDITVSRLTNDLGGAHEISLSYQLPCRVSRKRVRAIKCPKF